MCRSSCAAINFRSLQLRLHSDVLGGGVLRVARPSAWQALRGLCLIRGKLLDPVEAVLIERERLQLHPMQTGLDLPAVHLTA